jgi:fructose transport system substrate-binding protein
MVSTYPDRTTRRKRARALGAVGAMSVALTLVASACGSSDSSSSGTGGTSDKKIGVTLITKNATNPFFVAMQKGAQEDAAKNGVDLTVAAGKKDGDEETQVQAIENAIAKGQKGILITPNGPGVNAAIKKARDAGLFVIALDTPPEPANTVDITFATDNFAAGNLIGQWASKTLAGKPATIAMLDLFNDKVVSVDVNRDQGFLTGMGIDTNDKTKNGDEAKTGSYSGGSYTLVCNEPTDGAEDGGRSAMERCLTKNPGINVVYTINEPAAVGAYNALKAAGKEKGVTIVSVDGGCAGVKSVKDGIIGATSQQYPLKMASLGVEAIARIAKGGAKPTNSDGLDFFNTGVALVTDKPADGVTSITTAEGGNICWG